MFQTSPPDFSHFGTQFPPSGRHRDGFRALQQQAQDCTCQTYRDFFSNNRSHIEDRCRDRDPHAYRTDNRGCRWENNRPAQTQIQDQTASQATLQAGNNKLTINKADSSIRIQNADGTEQSVDLKFWGDPHVNQNGHELGTIKKDISLTLKDGTQVNLLMGDGHGGKPQPGAASFVDTAAIRSPDGTGALVTNISGPGNLGVTPLDSSHSSEFMAGQALNKFGHYQPSHVGVDGRGNMIDRTNGQLVHDQNGLNRLDQEQGSLAAAQSFWRQGYVPRDRADRYDQPFDQYTPDMHQSCIRDMQRMFRDFTDLGRKMPGMDCFEMPFARFDIPFSWSDQNRIPGARLMAGTAD